ncbi:MAG: alpha-ketoglutarate-dependent dioxygenase AlkB [Polyangiaceae bacterium]|nr:alpha-ketoglutarate-dependent dioxygenase AlkB [Polyangiaceae bacterium]
MLRDESYRALDKLKNEESFSSYPIRLFGREMLQPRLIAWAGEADYTYSGHVMTPQAPGECLGDLRRRVECHLGMSFNHILLNLYRDGNDSMGQHSDDEPELGSRPTIASLSLGAPRRFTWKRKSSERKSSKPRSIELGEGDLLIMSGNFQMNYLHALPKTRRFVGERLNLTFRRIQAPKLQ